MNARLLCVCAVCVVGDVLGQFDALPGSDATWLSLWHFENPGGTPPEWDESFTYYLEATDHDTLIHDTIYDVLWGFEQGVGSPGGFRGGLYDNGLGQVYYFHPNSNGSFLLYDFDLSVGDSVPVFVGEAINPTAYMSMMYVDTVTELIIGGSTRKCVGIQSLPAILGGQGIVHWWIQGIGGTGGLLSSYGNLFLDGGGGLECMSANDTVWWAWEPTGEPGSCMSVGMDEGSDLEQLGVSPNPSRDMFEFNDGQPRFFTVINAHGMAVLTERSSVIDLSGHPPGCYVAVVATQLGTFPMRLVVER